MAKVIGVSDDQLRRMTSHLEHDGTIDIFEYNDVDTLWIINKGM